MARGIAVIALMTTAAFGAVGPGARAATSDTATGYQSSATHDGHSADTTLTPPLAATWRRDLGGTVSYPVVANGIAYVTVANADTSGTRLFALDLASGDTVWGPIDLGGSYGFSALTYDAGVVFALNYSGVLRAFDATTGSSLWTATLGSFAFTSPPTAMNGLLYTAGPGSLIAVRENDGTVAWIAPVHYGDHSSPAVTPDGVYVAYACNQAYDFDPATGALIWHHTSDCAGGGGATVAVHGGRVYTRDFEGDLVLDAASGAVLGTYSATPIPAFDGSMGYFLNGRTLNAVDDNGVIHWSFSGDGSLDSAPLIDNGYVYVGSSKGALYAVDESTGSAVWSTNLGVAIAAPDEHNATVLTGFAAAEGALLVPAGTTLTAFGEAGPSIVATASGTSGAHGWFTSPVTVHFTCTAGAFAITSCPADVRLNKQGGHQIVTGTVSDTSGRTATTSVTVDIDWSAPSGSVTSSSDTVNRTVEGTASDHVSGVDTVVVTFTSATGTVTEPATLSACNAQNTGCVDWTAAPPAGLIGTGTGPASVWTGTVTATVTDLAGLTTTTAPVRQTLLTQ